MADKLLAGDCTSQARQDFINRICPGWFAANIAAERIAAVPLKLSLRPSERFVVNGAVVQNGDRRCVLVLQNHASILREKDIMQPEEAASPARRIYFPIMLLYLEEGDAQMLRDEAQLRLGEFAAAITQSEARQECAELAEDLAGGRFYRALTRCRKLMAYEESVLGGCHVDQGLSAGRQ